MMRRKQKGFTLIELMIVVAIIGVIGAIAVPSYNNYMKKSRRSDAKVGLTKVADRQERYYLQNNTYTASVNDLGPGATWVTDEGYYMITISNADAKGFTLTAQAIAGEAQSTDTSTSAGDCTQIVLDSTGKWSAPLATDPDGTDDSVPDCW